MASLRARCTRLARFFAPGKRASSHFVNYPEPRAPIEGATLAGLPPRPVVLYRVRATYRYTRQVADELSLDVGDVICVIEYDQKEEGWLMGIKETTNEIGLFPDNFTRPI